MLSTITYEFNQSNHTTHNNHIYNTYTMHNIGFHPFMLYTFIQYANLTLMHAVPNNLTDPIWMRLPP